MKREDVIECYLINSPKVVAEMLYDTIERYENRTCESCRYVGYVKTDGTSYCSDNNTVYKDPVKEKFCCNRYEAKEK